MLNILKLFYAINGSAAILFYVPQIRAALNAKSAMRSVSLVTFGGWSFGGFVTVLYAWFHAHDLMFVGSSFGGMMGAVSMFCIVASKRIIYRQSPDKGSQKEERSTVEGKTAPVAARPLHLTLPYCHHPIAGRHRKTMISALHVAPME